MGGGRPVTSQPRRADINSGLMLCHDNRSRGGRYAPRLPEVVLDTNISHKLLQLLLKTAQEPQDYDPKTWLTKSFD